MILLKKVRLINWYGFSNVTAPIGFFTLIAGKNGNGKSVVLDAVKYAAYGDTVFNKSSEGKGSRTILSYTRGLLDATAGTYIRPADQVPNVYSHIVLEYYDDVEEKSFVCGAVIETNAANNCQTYRYVMDRASMEQVEHTYEENGLTLPYSASSLQKRYGVKLMNRDDGLQKFMQMTGLKLPKNQIPTYLRKLRSIMSYDPNDHIDRFIREWVLEKRDVDFKKLIEAKDNIENLNGTFEAIQSEIDELDGILSGYDVWENAGNRLLADDIRIVYKKLGDLEREIKRHVARCSQARQQKEDIEGELAAIDKKTKDNSDRLIQARLSLERMDSTRTIRAEEEHLASLEREKHDLMEMCRKLEHFQTVISEIMDRFFRNNEKIADRDVLSSLCRQGISAAKKSAAVDGFRRLVNETGEGLVKQIAEIELSLEDIERRLETQHRIIDECKRHRNAFEQIPDYVGLRDDINREFAKRKISSKAQFACEYVISLKDEKWRDAIEAFLGPRRYTILVEPKYYDIADEVLNRSKYRYAHLFNTALLMKKELKVEEESVVSLLEIKNPVAGRYFEYQLGRMRMADIRDVKKYENAISKEGRVSVAMDSYFLRFDRIRSYYLGQNIYELNRDRAEAEIQRLKAERTEALGRKKELEGDKICLSLGREFFTEYDYDAHGKYQEAAQEARETEANLKRLKKALEDNMEYIELTETVSRLESEQESLHELQSKKISEKSEQDAIIAAGTDKIEEKSAEQKAARESFNQYEVEYYALTKQTVEAYDRYIQNKSQGSGGLLKDRDRLVRDINRYQADLVSMQADYSAGHPGSDLPRGTEGREQYASRREQIWIDNLQEVRQKLEEQTRRYEDIFKNEFVLTILKSCERARADLKQMNGELGKLDFAAKYQFDVHYVRDGSDYAKILEYARFLDEREQLGGGADGQMTFEMLTSVSDEEGEKLEQEMKQIVNRIIESNNKEIIERFADYRNYMTYEILISNQVLNRARLSRQTGYNSGAEVQIPYILILCSALLMIYNQRPNSTRLVFIDEPFAKMDPGNVKLMLKFMKDQRLQVIFCSPDKTESIGNECEVILPALRVRPESMQLGIVQFNKK
ncbi:MAG: hypothetical protein LUC41_02780 [Clostridiales bacterium]|nr:hypothetical protein [Clostridiales bacterium]